MKKQILLLTTIYPAPDLKYGTSAIHYFTREWVKMGYEVKVIHYQAVYPSVFYLIAKIFREFIASKTGAVVYTKKEKANKHYIMEGVNVYRYPVFKKIPHGKFSKKQIKKQIKKLIKINKEDNFSPDIITGHFINPQLEIIHELKKIYNSKTCMIMHDKGDKIKQIYKKSYNEYIQDIDIWGYRSESTKKGFEKNFGKQKHSFICYSGIPSNYIRDSNNRNFSEKLKNFIYVGEFIKRKYPVTLIDSISNVYINKDFKLTYIGKGAEAINLKHKIKKLNLNRNVTFLGFLDRAQIIKSLDNSDCLIMISKNEAFGLVYLEAMARGCITIGSRNEGIDGVIKNGINGFLCEAGNSVELSNIIKHINALTSEEIKIISDNAITTAKQLTDYKAAGIYINNLINLKL